MLPKKDLGETIEKEFSKTCFDMGPGKPDLVIVYDCSEAHFAKAVRRWNASRKERTGERLCREIHRINPDCIALTQKQFDAALAKHGVTEADMEPRRISETIYPRPK